MRQNERSLFMIDEKMNIEMEERTEDRRIRKTKKALSAAMVRLLSRKNILEITIKELTDEADVHRGTFYHHYKDVFDLRQQVEREVRQELRELVDSVSDRELANGPYPLLLKVLTYLEENRDEAKMLTSENGCPELLQELCANISIRSMRTGLFGEHLRYGNRFCASGIQGMIVSWVEDKMRMPPKEMAKVMETMMVGKREDQAQELSSVK